MLLFQVWSLKQHLLNSFQEQFNKHIKDNIDIDVIIKLNILHKNKLKKWTSFEQKSDLHIIIHNSEGRLLLTDQNGI